MLRIDSSERARATGEWSDELSGELFQQCLRNPGTSRKSEPAPNRKGHQVTVKPGDTLSDIAKRDGVSLGALLGANRQFNPTKADGVPSFDRSKFGQWDPDYIRPGDHVRLPAAQSRNSRTGNRRAEGARQRRAGFGTAAELSPCGRAPTPPRRPAPTPPRAAPPATPLPPKTATPAPLPGPAPATSTPPATPLPPQAATPGPLPGPAPTPQPAATPSDRSHESNGPHAFVPIPVGNLIPSKGGIGIENSWKFSKKPRRRYRRGDGVRRQGGGAGRLHCGGRGAGQLDSHSRCRHGRRRGGRGLLR